MGGKGKRFKTLHINGEEWRYSIKENFTAIWPPSGKRLNFETIDILGISPQDFQDMLYQIRIGGTSWNGIGPADVKKYIEENLIGQRI